MSPPEARLLVGGKLYSGWSHVRVTRSLEAFCGAFELSVFDRWAGQQTKWPIKTGDACELLLGTTPVVTGRVFVRELGLRAASASVSGRDATSYLVDCSCNLGQWEFVNVDLLTFCRRVCAPYGIPVTLQAGLDATRIAVPKKLSVEPGDTAAQAIKNACRIAGLLTVADGVGGLLLTRAGTARCRTAIQEGVNLLDGSIRHDISERYGTVHVLGSRPGDDEAAGSAVQSTGTATDSAIDAKRVVYVRAEGAVTAAQAKVRAQWEVSVRAALGETVSVTVQGWEQASGELWSLNQLVRVKAPTLELDNDLLIVGIEQILSRESGTTTTLTLRRPDAFTPMPLLPMPVPPAAGSGGYPELRGGV